MFARRIFLNQIGLGAVGVAFCPGRALAADISAAAKRAYSIGQWQAAADLARVTRSSDSLAFAARSLLAGILLDKQGRLRAPMVSEARGLAESALALERSHVEGRLQLATALGLQARLVSPVRAFTSGFPQHARRLLDSVITDAPTQAWAYALLGGWHLEGLRIGGPAAHTMLGADVAKGRTAFERAMTLDPREPSIPFYFGLSFLCLNPEANAAKAKDLFARSSQLDDDDMFRTTIIARAKLLTEAIESKSLDRAVRIARSWL